MHSLVSDETMEDGSCAPEYEWSSCLATVVHGDTDIRIRTLQRRNEEPDTNPMMQAQDSAPRRIRLGWYVHIPLFMRRLQKMRVCRRRNLIKPWYCCWMWRRPREDISHVCKRDLLSTCYKLQLQNPTWGRKSCICFVVPIFSLIVWILD